MIPGRAWLGLAVLGASSAWAGENPYAWVAPPPAAQLHGDDAGIPEGKGAVFVPRMSAPGEEPDALFVDGDRVVRGPVGARVLLDPGAYVVLVGTGEPEQRVGVQVVVEAGRTTLVPVRWGALRVESVSKSLRPRADSFELVHLGTGERVQVPTELAGDAPPRTWLLQPGLYRLQEPGMGSVASPVFSTVHVPEAGLVNVRLFVDRAGAIRGGGVVQAESFADLEVKASPWTRTLVVGIDAAGSQTRNIPGFPDLTVGQGSAFVDLDVGYRDKRSAVGLAVDAEYGLLLLQPATGEPLPLIKSRDRLRGDLGYTFRLNDGAGIYVRGAAETQMTDTLAVATETGDIAYRELDGRVRTQAVNATDTYQLAKAFNPLILHTGAGLEVRLTRIEALELMLRGGVAYRSMRFAGTYVPTDNPNTPAIEYTAIGAFNQPGVEAGVGGALRLTGFATYTTRLDAFTAFTGDGGLMVAWDNTLAVRLTRAISLNYQLNAARVPWVTDRVQLRHGAFFRFALNVL